MFLGSWKIDDSLVFPATIHDPDTGGGTTATVDYRIYEDVTATAIQSGTMSLLDSSNAPNLYTSQLSLAAASGFDKGKAYTIYMQAVIDSVTGSTTHSFQIGPADANITQWLGSGVNATVDGIPDVNLAYYTGETAGALLTVDDILTTGDLIQTSDLLTADEVEAECSQALSGYDPPTYAEMEARTLPSGDYGSGGGATAAEVRAEMDDYSTMLAEISGNTDTLETVIADIPTTSEFEARTIPSGNYLEVSDLSVPTTGEIADAVWEEVIADHTSTSTFGGKNQKVVPSETIGDYKATGFATPTNITAGTITTVTNLVNAPTVGDLTSTMKSSIGLEVGTSLTGYDGPTNAEMEARTLPSGDYFSASSDDVYLGDGAHGGASSSLILSNYDDFTGTTASNPNILLSDEIATVTDQTHFTLTSGSNEDNAYNDQAIVLYDNSNSDFPSIRKVASYVGSTMTVELDSSGDFALGSDDSIRIFVTAPGTTSPTVGQIRAEMDSASTMLNAISGYTDSVETTLGSAGDGLTAIPWNSTWNIEISGEAANALSDYDPPTYAEMEARTLPSGDYGSSSLTASDIRVEMDSASTMLSAISGYTDTLEAGIADVPTVSEFEARTIPSGDYLEASDLSIPTSGEIAGAVWEEVIVDHTSATTFGGKNQKVVPSETVGDYKATGFATPTNITAGTITTVTNLANAPIAGDFTSTMKTSLGASLSGYDGPTNTEMEARTLPSGDYFLASVDNVYLGDGAHGGSSATFTLSNYDDFTGTSATNPNVLLASEISGVTDQTHLVLNDGSTVNDTYDNQSIVLYDNSNSDYPSIRKVNSYVGSTKTVTLDSAPDFTLDATDSVRIFVTAPGSTAPTVGQIRAEMDDNSTMLSAISGYTDTLEASVADIPTVSEFEARTLPSGDYGSSSLTATDIRAEIDDNSTMLAAISGYTDSLESDISSIDTPTLSQFNARTLLSSDYFDASSDTVAHVTLVDTTTTASNMRGTDGANTTTPPTVGAISDEIDSSSTMLAAISGYTDTLETLVGDVPTTSEFEARTLPSGDYGSSDLTASDIRIEVDTNSTMLAAISGYTDDIPTVTQIRSEIDDNSTMLLAISGDTNELQTDWVDGGRLDSLLDQVYSAVTGLEDISTSDIKTQVVAAISGDTYGESGAGTPAATASLMSKMDLIYKALRNKTIMNSTTNKYEIYGDDGTLHHSTTISDDGSIMTRNELGGA